MSQAGLTQCAVVDDLEPHYPRLRKNVGEQERGSQSYSVGRLRLEDQGCHTLYNPPYSFSFVF